MDPSRPKTPDFTMDPSPPNFPYDFNAESSASPATAAAFEAFAYGSFSETSPRLGFNSLALNTAPPFFAPHMYHHPPHSSPTAHSFTSAASSARPVTPLEGHDLATIAPPLTLAPAGLFHAEIDDPGTARARESSNSPPSSGYSAGGARSQRYTPMAPHRAAARRSATATRRGLRREEDDLSDEEGEGAEDPGMDVGVPSSDIIQRRREEIRRQRIESEQRRRDELRDGYAKLKYALPVSNQKSSKVSLLDRAVTYIRQLETNQGTLQSRLDNAENELTRLRNVNEQLMRNLADQHRAVTLSALAAANAQASASSTSSTASEPPSPAGAKKLKNKSSPTF